MENGERVVKFDEESFHATPHEWIALAYTYHPKVIDDSEKNVTYNMGVSLFDDNKEVVIHGVNNLEESLQHMYGDGGHLYSFDANKFVYKEGLGPLEVVSSDPVAPLEVEFIEDSVSRMKDLGVRFIFIDVTKKI